MFKCNCGKEFEKQRSLSSHARFCTSYVKKEKIALSSYVCECGKTFEKSQSLNAHYSHCEKKRKGKVKNRGKGGWCKGMTKLTHPGLLKMAVSLSEKESRKWTLEEKAAQSLRMKGKTGGYREGTNKWKGGRVFSLEEDREVWLDSRWEIHFVSILDKFSIRWKKNKKERFPYIWEGSRKFYYPDFFLPELNVWVEVKGWEREQDREKWKAFPHRLFVIRGNYLKRLDLLDDKDALMAELVYAQD